MHVQSKTYLIQQKNAWFYTGHVNQQFKVQTCLDTPRLNNKIRKWKSRQFHWKSCRECTYTCTISRHFLLYFFNNLFACISLGQHCSNGQDSCYTFNIPFSDLCLIIELPRHTTICYEINSLKGLHCIQSKILCSSLFSLVFV